MFLRAKRKQSELVDAYKRFFDLGDPLARLILADMARAAGVFGSTFDTDPYQHAFNAGEANTVLRIFTTLQLTPMEVAELDKEG